MCSNQKKCDSQKIKKNKTSDSYKIFVFELMHVHKKVEKRRDKILLFQRLDSQSKV